MKLFEMVDATTQFVDVRTKEEFATGHIQGALNIPLPDLAKRKQEIKDLGTKPVVFYCRSGNRSELAVYQLQREGYKLVYNGGGLDDAKALLRK